MNYFFIFCLLSVQSLFCQADPVRNSKSGLCQRGALNLSEHAGLKAWVSLPEDQAIYVSYEFSGGRFGDNLLTYMHAKWLSFHYKVPLLYRPFLYSDQLLLHEKEKPYFSFAGERFRVSEGYERTIFQSPGLYFCPYFPENRAELLWEPQFHFASDWKDPHFRSELLGCIAPKEHLSLLLPPKDQISIAVHVREGGGYDDSNTKFHAPFKIPPLKFYTDALPRVLSLLRGKKVYLRLFTDAVDPKPIAEALHFAAQDFPLTLEYRVDKSGPHQQVLEDFFSLFHYDILIRPQSNFSIIPSLLHDYAVVCSPSQYRTVGRMVLITGMDIEVNDSLFQELLAKKGS